MDLGINREVQVSIPMPSGYIQDPSRLQQMYNKSLGMVEGMCPPAPPAPAPIDVQQQHNQGMGNMSSLSSMSMRAQQHPHHHQQQNSSSSVTIREHHQHQAQPLQIQYPQENNTSSVRNSGESKAVRYRECRKNHAASIGGYAVDGCGEFMPSGEDGTPAALKCAACNCHRNFHRREVEGEIGCECHQSARR